MKSQADREQLCSSIKGQILESSSISCESSKDLRLFKGKPPKRGNRAIQVCPRDPVVIAPGTFVVIAPGTATGKGQPLWLKPPTS